MSFVFGCLVLREKHVPVHLNFFLSLLLAHLQLVLPVLQVVHLINGRLKNLINLLNLQFHTVVPYQHLLLGLGNPLHIVVSHVILENQGVNKFLIFLFLLLHIILLLLYGPEVLLELFETLGE
jgi:hypothetical protein